VQISSFQTLTIGRKTFEDGQAVMQMCNQIRKYLEWSSFSTLREKITYKRMITPHAYSNVTCLAATNVYEFWNTRVTKVPENNTF